MSTPPRPDIPYIRTKKPGHARSWPGFLCHEGPDWGTTQTVWEDEAMTSLRLKPATRNQLQRAQKLHRREQRTRHGQFLVEGPQAVREVLACEPGLIRDLYVSEGAFERYPEIRELAVSAGVWTHIVDDDALRDLSGDGQGFVVVAEMPQQPTLESLLADTQLAIAAVGASDPGNVGTIVRSADAAGAGAVLLTKGCAELTAPKVVRSTVGSLFHVPAATNLDLAEIIAQAHAAGMQVLAAEGTGEWDLPALVQAAYGAGVTGGPDISRSTLWVVGNEARGFDGVDLSEVDAKVAIPLYGQAESLNVSVAASICLYTTAMAQRTVS